LVRRFLTIAAAVALLGLAAAPAVQATNTRVSISNFAWSNPRVEIDLDEKVTWDWIGPDLAHSVTGISPNALGWDSDPNTDAPSHLPGDSYTVQFTQSGVYAFQCKLHASVRGEVAVSNVPGDPNSDPGPQAPLKLDVTKPTLGSVVLQRQRFHSRKGTTTTAQINERGTLEAEYFWLRPNGSRKFNGYATWKAFIGINRFGLGARGKHFKAKPGRYLAVLRATDQSANVSKPVRKHFEILG
jgi:plastocyanin